MHKNLPTVEGLKTRFLCSISAAEGTNTTLAGYVKVGGESLPMTAGGENELVAPATAAGDYLYELRAGGSVVLWGHLCARPSAFPAEEDATAIEVAATITGETAVAVSITLKEGPQGPKGDTGEPGPQGLQGPKGDKGDKGDPLTYTDLTEEQRVGLVEPLVYEAATDSPDVSTEDNYKAYGFGCVMARGGKVEALTLQSRANGQSTPTGTLVWVKVWRGASQQLIAVSENSQQYAEDAALHYTFAEAFAVDEGEELRISYHTEEGLDTTAYQMGVECRVRVTAKEPTTPGGMLGDQGGYGAEGSTAQRSWVPLYTWQMQVERFAPAEHAEDEVKHLTTEERAGLAELLARKDELLALLA